MYWEGGCEPSTVERDGPACPPGAGRVGGVGPMLLLPILSCTRWEIGVILLFRLLPRPAARVEARFQAHLARDAVNPGVQPQGRPAPDARPNRRQLSRLLRDRSLRFYQTPSPCGPTLRRQPCHGSSPGTIPLPQSASSSSSAAFLDSAPAMPPITRLRDTPGKCSYWINRPRRCVTASSSASAKAPTR